MIVMMLFLTSCVVHRQTIPIENVRIPQLDKSKSRVFLYNNGYADGGGRAYIGEIQNAETNKTLAKLLGTQCTFIDFEPGRYKFRALAGIRGAEELVTESTLTPGSTNYMVLTYNVGVGVGLLSSFGGIRFGNESHLIQLIPESGKKIIQGCNHVASIQKSN